MPDIEDAINQMLGRDPEQHRPPRLAWGQLVDALADTGVAASEQELIAAALTIEPAPEVEALADTPVLTRLVRAHQIRRHQRDRRAHQRVGRSVRGERPFPS